MFGKRPHWMFSIAMFVAWAIILPLVHWLDSPLVFRNVLYVFYGYAIGWLASSIARKVYK